MTSSSLRVVLIGCGWHAIASHAPALARYRHEQSGVVLAGVCDRDGAKANQAAGQFGFGRSYEDIETMLDAEQPDACVCVLPVEAVVPWARTLLERGLPTLLEKPLGTNLAEARSLAEVTRATGTPHMVSLNRRFAPPLVEGLAWARQRGPLRYVRGTMLRRNRTEQPFLWATGIHTVDATIACGGALRSHSVQRLGSAGAPPWAVVELDFASGARGLVEVLPTAGVTGEVYELFGEGYRVRACVGGDGGPMLECWHRDHGAEPVVRVDALAGLPLGQVDGTYAETATFLDALKVGRRPHPEIADAMVATEIAAAMAGEGV